MCDYYINLFDICDGVWGCDIQVETKYSMYYIIVNNF